MNDQVRQSGRRIVVTGVAGAGKSTVAKALEARTGLPLFHLDLAFWKPGWVEPSESQWRDQQRELLAGDGWIADGNYTDTLDLRLERADTVVVLATPWWRCAGRAMLRGLRMPDRLPAGSTYTRWQRLRDEWRLVPRLWAERGTALERELAIIDRHGQHAAVHLLRSPAAVKEFLAGFGARPQTP